MTGPSTPSTSRDSITSPNEQTVIVRDGKPLFTVVTSHDPEQTIRDAVDELNYWIKRITGVSLPVATTDEWNKNSPYIAIGPSKLMKENGWDDGPMKQEEARVFIEANRIGLIGNDRAPFEGVAWTGTFYAVLEFVQKELGVRWIWPGQSGEVFTPRSTLTVTTSSWTWTPDLTLMRVMINGFSSKRIDDLAERYFNYFDSKPDGKQSRETLAREHDVWLKRERMNRSTNVKFGHSFTNWWNLYGQKHPDWFAKPPQGVAQHGGKGVKLNISNPEVLHKIISNWEEKRGKNPSQNKILTVGPNDSRGFDTRPETRAWDAPRLGKYSDAEIFSGHEPVLSDRYVKFWNKLACRVAAIDPEARVTTFAYRNYQAPPIGPEHIEPNIIIAYVGGEGYYPDERHITDEWTGWTEKGATLTWRPNLLHTGHGTPYLFSRQLFHDFNFFRNRGMAGTTFDTLVGNWPGQGLTYYVLAETHSRPEATYDELASEYFGAFGPAEGQIKAYHEYFEQRTTQMPKVLRQSGLVPRQSWGGWWIGHIRIIPLFLTPSVITEAEQILHEAKEAVISANPSIQKRVKIIDIGFQHAKLMAETFRRLHLHEPDRNISFSNVRDVLTPLWEFRKNVPPDSLIPITRYLVAEERHLGIWSAFRIDSGKAPGQTAPDARRKLDKGWTFEADYDEKSIGWYHTGFDVPELADTGARVFLRFDTIAAVTLIKVNGKRVFPWEADHTCGRHSITESTVIDISNAVTSGAENSLSVRVKVENIGAKMTSDVFLIVEE